MAASRRTVTVLFCDVVDWTPLGGDVDPEVLREQQTRYHEEARAVLEQHGGTVEKFIGDAVMAVFGWPAVREDDAPLYARRLDVPFVGRGDELRSLERELDRVRDGCRLVTVVGPPGIGKSRLAFELVERVRGTATVLTGRCLPYGDGITFWPLAEALREAGREDVLADTGAGELFWRVRGAFEELAADRPLVLVFEDIHWAEPTFLDLLEYLVGWTLAPILLLCLARPELYERRPD